MTVFFPDVGTKKPKEPKTGNVSEINNFFHLSFNNTSVTHLLHFKLFFENFFPNTTTVFMKLQCPVFMSEGAQQ